jgi:hypothetical protein
MEHLVTIVAPQLHNIREYVVFIKLNVYVVPVQSLIKKTKKRFLPMPIPLILCKYVEKAAHLVAAPTCQEYTTAWPSVDIHSKLSSIAVIVISR